MRDRNARRVQRRQAWPPPRALLLALAVLVGAGTAGADSIPVLDDSDEPRLAEGSGVLLTDSLYAVAVARVAVVDDRALEPEPSPPLSAAKEPAESRAPTPDGSRAFAGMIGTGRVGAEELSLLGVLVGSLGLARFSERFSRVPAAER
jgi:hypothetical protein